MNKELFKEYKNKKILITGGAGCIGSNLIYILASLDVGKITVIDDLSSSARWNIPEVPNLTFVEGDILDESLLKELFSEGPDYVFHLAALFANQNSVEDPQKDLMVNGLGTLKVLKHARLFNVKKVIYASSGCSVYGNHAPLPLKEDYVSINLDTPYQITKLLGELYCNFFYNYYSLPIVRLRFFNVYGPGEIPGKYRNVIPNFIYRAIHKQCLPITGTGEETRDFTYVEDIIEGILAGGVVPQAIGEAINLASEKETKIIDLAKTINTVLNNREMAFLEKRKWDKTIRRRASIEKAKRILGYNPKTKIFTGLEKTVEWIKHNLAKIEKSARF